jgi:hypothetical protein
MDTMWCKFCRQDVPALSLPNEGKLYCPRCGEDIESAASLETEIAAAESSYFFEHGTAEPNRATPDFAIEPDPHDWELEDRLRHIERLLESAVAENPVWEEGAHQRQYTFAAPHAVVPPWHSGDKPIAAERPSLQTQKTRSQKKRSFAVVIWLMISVGSIAAVGGGALLGWSLLSNRQELWTYFLPATCFGQLMVLVGLLLQTRVYRRENGRAAEKLDAIGKQLDTLRTTAQLLNEGHGHAASYCAHGAHGDGPQSLLADLKSRLDSIAVQLDRLDGN